MAKTSIIRKPATADAFVGGEAKTAPVRTTIDLNPVQHRALKIQALQGGVGIAAPVKLTKPKARKAA